MSLRAAVVGAGMMGRHHVRILGSMPDVDLVAVVDPDPGRAAKLAPAGVAALLDIDQMPVVDLAVVAVPTEAHARIAIELISRGIHVLVEKPLARSVEEASLMIDAASQAGVTLGVGHVERFNPVVMALQGLVREPIHMQFDRMSPYTPRIGDSVVFDLMVHDLDLACMLAGSPPDRVETVGASVFTDLLDIATAILHFPGGCVAALTASRTTQDKIRRISVTERERYIVADCLRQDLSIKRETTSEYVDNEAGTYREASVIEIPHLDRRSEPLAAELRDFVDAVLEGRAPQTDGRAGRTVIDLALRVETAARSRG